MLEGIKKCKVTMCYNGGNRSIEEEGHYPGVGQSYLDKRALKNIVSQSEVIKRGYKVKFDSEVENSFVMDDLVGWVIRYLCDERGLYVRKHLPPVNCHVLSVSATSIEGYTQCKIERVGRARKLNHDLSAEKIGNVKVWLRSNQAKNVPVSVEDVNLAEKVFKTDVATCK